VRQHASLPKTDIEESHLERSEPGGFVMVFAGPAGDTPAVAYAVKGQLLGLEYPASALVDEGLRRSKRYIVRDVTPALIRSYNLLTLTMYG
jgi:hypothetical protein